MVRSIGFPLCFAMVSMSCLAAQKPDGPALPPGLQATPPIVIPPVFSDATPYSQALALRWDGTNDLADLLVDSTVFWAVPVAAAHDAAEPNARMIDITINPGGLTGGKHEGALVLTAAAWSVYTNEVQIPIRIRILPKISPSPATITLYRDGQLAQRFITLYSLDNRPYQVTGMEQPPPLRVSFQREEGERKQFVLSLPEEADPAVLADKQLVFRTNHPHVPRVEVPIRVIDRPSAEETRAGPLRRP